MWNNEFKKTNMNVFIIIYVDDILIIGLNIADIEETKFKIRKKSEMTDIGS